MCDTRRVWLLTGCRLPRECHRCHRGGARPEVSCRALLRSAALGRAVQKASERGGDLARLERSSLTTAVSTSCVRLAPHAVPGQSTSRADGGAIYCTEHAARGTCLAHGLKSSTDHAVIIELHLLAVLIVMPTQVMHAYIEASSSSSRLRPAVCRDARIEVCVRVGRGGRKSDC